MSRNTFLKIIMIPFVLITIMIIKETTVSANINNQEIVNEHGALLSQLVYGDSNTFVSNDVQNGFINNNSQVYYYNSQGQMIYGEQKIDNNWYYFDKITGAMVIGFQNLGNKTVYYNSQGQMIYGEQKIDNNWYYFDKITGAMAMGFQDLGNKIVYYNSQGQMIYGEQKIDNNWYYFDKVTGAMSDDSTIVPKNAKEAGINGYNNGGWGYYSHNCTAFVAGVLSSQGVPDSIIRGLGNGSEWASRARNKGLRVDLIPEPGTAISFKGGTSLYPYAEGHVAYITSINNDGTFNIIEGNYSGLAYHERTIRVDSSVAGIIHF
ncbi:CHAP domain-containing protein [Leuconostoc gelidum]|uniref:CHAP domain-containing protein n=1 Tax=Leuconostoc gelidum TaxID=1244 RepID=UPI001CC5D5B9|nr:CHAP domain-containing protein [Leuconostoc gelidum]MBZ6001508.1 CHAP domain-containing protein [Leuconostoc gelidum subsp. gelidum]